MTGTITKVFLLVLGICHLLVTALTFLAPTWFFAWIAPFPPFNAHFLADIGAFAAPVGLGLLIAARAPARHRDLIGLAACGDLLHACSHLRDLRLHLPPYMGLGPGLAQEIALLLAGLILLGIAARGVVTPEESAAPEALPDIRR
jgi:hypothetical protein